MDIMFLSSRCVVIPSNFKNPLGLRVYSCYFVQQNRGVLGNLLYIFIFSLLFATASLVSLYILVEIKTQ